MQYTLTANDIEYLYFYLKEKDPTTGSISYYNLKGANSVVFRMRRYGSSSNTIETTVEVVTGTLGYCRCLVTVPPSGTFSSEIEVFNDPLKLTWEGPTYVIREELG